MDRSNIVMPEAEVILLDCDPALKPDIVCRLGVENIPLPDDSIDVVMAVHVLEHIGKTGETAEWFRFWEDLYRVMKSGAQLQLWAPMFSSVWAWGDPSHVRALSPESLTFFCQDSYRSKS